MRHEDRHIGLGENLAGGPAEDELPQTALRIAALDEEIGARGAGRDKNRKPRRLRRLMHIDRARRNAVALQTFGQLHMIRPAQAVAGDGEDRHIIRLFQQRQGEGDGARRFRTAVPGNGDDLAETARRAGRSDQERTAALDQRRFECRFARLFVRRARAVRRR